MGLVMKNIRRQNAEPAPVRPPVPLPPSSLRSARKLIHIGGIWRHDGNPSTPHPGIEGAHYDGLVRHEKFVHRSDFHHLCEEFADRFRMDIEADPEFREPACAVIGYGGILHSDPFTELMAERLRIPEVRYATNAAGLKLNKPLDRGTRAILMRNSIIGPEDPVFVMAEELQAAHGLEDRERQGVLVLFARGLPDP